MGQPNFHCRKKDAVLLLCGGALFYEHKRPTRTFGLGTPEPKQALQGSNLGSGRAFSGEFRGA